MVELRDVKLRLHISFHISEENGLDLSITEQDCKKEEEVVASPWGQPFREAIHGWDALNGPAALGN